MKKAYKVKISDNVAMLLQDVSKGETVAVNGTEEENGQMEVTALEDICAGHKVALLDIEQGGLAVKYGAIIGAATQAIEKGEHVHTHNLAGLRGRGDRA